MPKTKVCKKCLQELSLDSYNKHKDREFGLQLICKDCQHKEHRLWRESHKEHIKSSNKINYEIFKTRDTYRFARTKAGAKQRGIVFDIKFEKFLEILSGLCFYCDSKIHIGLDRIDSDRGYSVDNVVPCCYRCNVAKNTMTQEEFVDLCRAVINKYDANNHTL